MSFCPLFGIFCLWEKYAVLLHTLFIKFEKGSPKILEGDLHRIEGSRSISVGEGFFVGFDYIIVHTSV